MAATFEITVDGAGRYHFRLVTAEGRPLLRSEGYRAKASALAGAESVRRNAHLPHRLQRRAARDGRHYLTLKAGNGQVIAVGGPFPDEAGAASAGAAVRALAAGASLVDNT